MKLSTILAPLVAAGVSQDVILQTVIAWEAEHSDGLERRRESDARRQALKRERDKSNVTSRDVTVTVSSHDAGARAEGSSSNLEDTGNKKEKIRSPNGSRLPADFVPEPGVASGIGLTRAEFDVQLPMFRDYWAAKAGKDARKVDWQATWRNWCRRVVKDRKARAGPKKITDEALEWMDERQDNGQDYGSTIDGDVEQFPAGQGKGRQASVVQLQSATRRGKH